MMRYPLARWYKLKMNDAAKPMPLSSVMTTRAPFHALFMLCLAAGWLATASGQTPATPQKKIYAGVYLHDVTKFDQKDGVFDADFELWVKWRGAFDPDVLTIGNASQVEKEEIGQEQDGDWNTKRWRVRGTLRGEFPVQRFPFDEQTLSVMLELPVKYGELAPDLAGSGMRERFSVTGWLYKPNFFPRVSTEIYRSDLGAISSEGRPTKVGRTVFEVTLRRPLVTAATKLFLPLLVILLVAFVPLFVNPKELEVRASVGVTALLACFAFHFAVSDSMPNVTYITLAETLFLVSYGVCATLLCISVAAAALNERGHHRAHRSLDRVSLFALPVILALACFVAVPSVPQMHAGPDTPVVQTGPRPVSSRNVLRVGINTLTNPNFGLTARAAYWGTTRTAPGEAPFPVLVSQVPAVTNNSVRFLADGRLEVTWKMLPGLLWSDGKPLTADDLLFALEVDEDSRIDSKRVVNPLTMVVTYKERVAVAMKEILPLPRHVLHAAYEQGGYEAVRKFRDENTLPGTGAYYAKEWETGKRAVLEANPHFVGEPPSIKRIEITVYPEAELVPAFEKGEIDMISPNAISPELAQNFAKKRPDAVSIRPSDVLMFLHPDMVNNPALAKLEVRKALMQAFNRTRLRDDVFGDASANAPVAHIPVLGPMPAGAVKIAYNPDAAKAEIDKLGLAGTRIPLIHGPKQMELETVANLVRDAAAIGLVLEPRQVESTAKDYRDMKHGGLLLMQRTGVRDDEPERYWSVPRQGNHFNRAIRHNAFDDGIAELVEREERALYPERREQIRDMLFTKFTERLPLLPLLFQADLTVVDPELEGWEVGTGRSFALTVERWYFAPPPAPAPAPTAYEPAEPEPEFEAE